MVSIVDDGSTLKTSVEDSTVLAIDDGWTVEIGDDGWRVPTVGDGSTLETAVDDSTVVLVAVDFRVGMENFGAKTVVDDIRTVTFSNGSRVVIDDFEEEIIPAVAVVNDF